MYWNALSTLSENKYPSPLTLGVGTSFLHSKILRRDYVPITTHILLRPQKEQNCHVKQLCLPQDAPTEAVGLPPSCICLPLKPRSDLTQRWCANRACKLPPFRPKASLQRSLTCGTRINKSRALSGKEWVFPLQEFELQFYSAFRVGTKLHALRGDYHGLLFSFLLSIYQIGRDTQM